MAKRTKEARDRRRSSVAPSLLDSRDAGPLEVMGLESIASGENVRTRSITIMSQTIEHSGKTEFRRRLQKVEELVNQVEATVDPKARAGAIELVQTMMDLHGTGIERIMELVFEAGPAGRAIIDRFASDEIVSSLLLLYGLHPLPFEARVLQALDKVRPDLRSHGGDVELVGIEETSIRLRLHGNCHGCASSAMTLKLAIEEAIYDAAPDLTGLEVEGVVEQPPPSGLIQIERLPARKAQTTPLTHN